MATVSVVSPSHRIAMLMSAQGRFLECQDCRLRVQFTAGAHYEVIARQFESYAMSGDTAKAKDAYQDFLTLWTDADPDIPILKQAKAEYAKLQ